MVRLRDAAATAEYAREVVALIEAIEKAVADQTRRVRPRRLVPVRANPAMKSGRGIGTSVISG